MVDLRTKRAGVPHVRHNVVIGIGKPGSGRQSKGDTDDVNDIYDVHDKRQRGSVATCCIERTLKDAVCI